MTSGNPRRMLEDYDRGMLGRVAQSYYDGSDFYNYGYWSAGTTSQRQASENLVEKLLSFLPRREGTVLDVACGLGASTRYITKYFAPDDIAAVNLSEIQVGQTQRNAPGCDVAVMDAARLAFADNKFDVVLCVEAAFHFQTRRAFLAEAYRVLKPGGMLVMSDILYRPAPRVLADRFHLPLENRWQGPADYGHRLQAAGFREVSVVDATHECSASFSRNLRSWPFRRFKEDRNAGLLLAGLALALMHSSFALWAKHYLLVAATKPQKIDALT